MIISDWKTLINNFKGTKIFFKKLVRLNPEIHNPNISNPYFGTICISILLLAPTNNISELLSLSNNSLAIEIAGYI